jgi:prepilin-type N-terminal cleavage/methylation domain-containing protein/prepilin-type processing-associated H-X9-DG protein
MRWGQRIWSDSFTEWGNEMCLVKKRGFTLVELLVVIGIIAILIAILLPVLSSVRERSNRVLCAQQQRQVFMGLQLYAQQNRNWFPHGYWGGPYLIGPSEPVGKAMGGTEAALKLLACPSYTPYSGFDRPRELGTGNDPYLYFYSTYTYVGGAALFDQSGAVNLINGHGYFGWAAYDRLQEYLDPAGFGPCPKLGSRQRTSEVAILEDRMWPYAANAGGNGRYGAWGGEVILPNHMRNGRAEGGNVCFLDAHVEWRRTAESSMRVRTYYEYDPWVVY